MAALKLVRPRATSTCTASASPQACNVQYALEAQQNELSDWSKRLSQQVVELIEAGASVGDIIDFTRSPFSVVLDQIEQVYHDHDINSCCVLFIAKPPPLSTQVITVSSSNLATANQVELSSEAFLLL